MNSFKLRYINAEKLPLVIEPAVSNFSFEKFCEELANNQRELQNHLLCEGGILFRGFPVSNAKQFAKAIEALNLGKPINYIGGDSPRNKIEGAVYTSTEAPPSFKIPLHNELSFVKNYPKHIYFFAETAPKAAGETILGDARTICKAIRPDVKERFINKDLKYVSSYYEKSRLMELLNRFQRSHKSWPEVFETTSRKELEDKCLANDFQFEWTKNGWVTIYQKRPAIMRHPETQEEVWFNQVHLYDFNPRFLGLFRYLGAKLLYLQKHMRLHEVFFGDETKIPRSDIYHIHDVLDQHTIKFPWQTGDMLVLDNVLAMHGRAPFEGKRRILAAMTT